MVFFFTYCTLYFVLLNKRPTDNNKQVEIIFCSLSPIQLTAERLFCIYYKRL